MHEINFNEKLGLVLLSLECIILLLLFSSYKEVQAILLILTIGILLIPFIYAYSRSFDTKENNVLIFTLIIISLIFTRYFFANKYGFLIGTDSTFHYEVTKNILSSSGHILFDKYQTTSFSYVGLHTYYNIVSFVTFVDLEILARYMHPFINIILVSIYYVFVRKIFTQKIALLSSFIYGWSFYSFWFGYEFRNENVALLFLLLLLFFIFCTKSVSISIAKLICIFSILITHFVTSVQTILALFILLIVSTFSSKFSNRVKYLSIITLTFFSIYLLYISGNFHNIFLSIANNLNDGITNSGFSAETRTATVGMTYATAARAYGTVTFIGNWLYRILFLIGIVFFLKNELFNCNDSKIFVLMWGLALLGVLSATLVIKTTIQAPRIYGVFIIPASIFVSYSLLSLRNKLNAFNIRIFWNSLFFIVLIILILTSVFQYPVFAMNLKLNPDNDNGVYDLSAELKSVDFLKSNAYDTIRIKGSLGRLYNMLGYYPLFNEKNDVIIGYYYSDYSRNIKDLDILNSKIYSNGNVIFYVADLNQYGG